MPLITDLQRAEELEARGARKVGMQGRGKNNKTEQKSSQRNRPRDPDFHLQIGRHIQKETKLHPRAVKSKRLWGRTSQEQLREQPENQREEATVKAPCPIYTFWRAGVFC